MRRVDIARRVRCYAVFAAMSTAASIASGQDISDLDGDGQVSFDEYAIALRVQMDLQVVEDYDGDGDLTINDLFLSVERWLQAVQGDLNGDGVVDELDLNITINNQGLVGGVNTTSGDLDGDGDVDVDDLFIHMTQMGGTTPAPGMEDVVLVIQISMYGDSHGSYYNDDTHHGYFSSTWPPGHNQSSSDIYWPPDHEGTGSSRWDDPSVHSVANSRLYWPANHEFDTSVVWKNSGHDMALSVLSWPFSHRMVISLTWPDNHRIGVSRTWSVNHDAGLSILEEPSPHHVGVSDQWLHDQAVSASRWPPNHDGSWSASWQGHDIALSQTWPSNHSLGPSATWDGVDQPWPANHFQDVSATWDVPVDIDPGMPFWPADHSWFQTFLDVLDHVPGF